MYNLISRKKTLKIMSLQHRRQNYDSNAILLYRRIWLVAILRKILNLKVVTKAFNWKDPPSWKSTCHIYNNAQK
jgi:hypothetical protein